MFNPHDPIDPLGVDNVPYEMQGQQTPALDPSFQNGLRQASDQVLRRAKDQAMIDHPMAYDQINNELMNRELRRGAIEEEEQMRLQDQPNTSSQQPEINLSKDEKAAIIFQLFTTTIIPLEIVDSNDYNSKCKYCESEVRPFAEGPHHESECQRHTHILQIDTAAAHKKQCKHCSARPYVAGFHHKPDCTRGFPAIPTWKIERDDYSSKCKYCSSKVKPFSEGPHHEDQCQRHEAIPLFHTETAHDKYCTHCEARPFTAGPHHRSDCQRHKKRIAIPTALLNNN